jgi:hypothetical protein
MPARVNATAATVSASLVTVAPTNFRSTVNGSTVRLEWDMAPGAGVTNFRIVAGLEPIPVGRFRVDIAALTTPSAATILEVTNVPPGTYYVSVSGMGSDGIPGPRSNEIAVTVGVSAPPSGLPGQPTGLNRSVTGSQVVLSWVAGGGGPASSYVVEAGSGPGASDIIVFDTGNPAPGLVAFAPNGVYYVRVRGANAAGRGPASLETTVCVNVAPCPEPTRPPEVCNDGIDNDGDGQVDEDCARPPTEEPPPPPPPNGPPPPPPPTCTYTVSRNSVSMPFAGGTFDVSVTSNCSWSSSSSAGFISVANPGSGSGNGTVRFSVQSNTSTNSRNGTVTVAGTNIPVSQDGNIIIEVLEQPQVTLPPPPPGEPTPSATVTQQPGARPDRTAGPPVSVASAPPPPGATAPAGTSLRSFTVQSTTAFNEVVVSADVNAANAQRVTTMAVPQGFFRVAVSPAQFVVQITLAIDNNALNSNIEFAAVNASGVGPYVGLSVAPPPPPPCEFTVGQPSPATLPTAGGTFTVNITTNHAGCQWSAGPSNSAFITLAPGSQAAGDTTGTVTFTVAPNSGSARSGTIVFAWTGASVDRSVTQSGCSYTLTPPAMPLSGAAQTFDVGVTTQAGCAWSSSVTVPAGFLSPVAGFTSGNGNGTARFSVPFNSGGSRSGTIQVNGQPVNVTQASGCTYSLSWMTTGGSPQPINGNLSSRRQDVDLRITTASACTWSAAVNPPAAYFTDPNTVTPGTGTGTVRYNVQPNRTGLDRSATVVISTPSGNQTASIVQVHPVARIMLEWQEVDGTTDTDMDLYVLEPNGNLIYHSSTRGISGYLERDNKPRNPDPFTNARTEENVYVDVPLTGEYQVFFVHNGGDDNATNSKITITFDPFGAAAPPIVIGPRLTTTEDPHLGYNMVNVNVVARTHTPTQGTRPVP